MKKVIVAMSGGVDSSVSAALLKEAGYDVTGVFIRVWVPPFLECDWPTEREDARRVAAHLGIPFSTVDLEQEYKEGVVDYMIEEYRNGRTPNPDVMCNSCVKFGAFLKYAKEAGADYIATGHYAQVKENDGVYEMYSGVDSNKDQTYFLWKLGQDELKHTLFPVGGMKKSKVRELAEKFELPVAQKKDSQGVCFLGHLDMRDFLKRFIETEKGDVLDTEGNVIGEHGGALLYTRGQRRGFTITKNSPDQEPHFVVDKDAENNTITVGTKEEERKDFGVNKVVLGDINKIEGEISNGTYLCRFRHRQTPHGCSYVDGVVTFDTPQDAVGIGQSLVLYTDEGKCIGGGVIDAIL